jgi:hypothetical protein
MSQADQGPGLQQGPTVPASHGDRLGHGVVAVLLAGVFAASFLGIDRWRTDLLPGVFSESGTICLLRNLTGLPCPTCGMTRSFCAVSRGEVGRAIDLHPLGLVVYAVFALVMVRSCLIAISGRMRWKRAGRAFVWSVPILAAATILVWIARLAILVSSGAAAEAWRSSVLARMMTLLT